MNENMIMFGIATVVTLLSTIFWRWVSNISKDNDETVIKIDKLKTDVSNFKLDVSRHYQSKEDARHDHAQVMTLLGEIKASVVKLADKMDNKADKS